MDIRLNNILISSQVTEAGLITPPVGWYELGSVENPGLTIGTHAEGLHTYDSDIAVGPSGEGVATVVEQYPDGVGITAASANVGISVIHGCSCSLELDPVVSIVWRYNAAIISGVLLGVASEDVTDNSIVGYENLRIGVVADASPAAIGREQPNYSLPIPSPSLIDGDWYQIDFEPADYGYVKIYHLASSDLADRDDGGTLVLDEVFSFDGNLPGSVVAPVFGCRSDIATPANDRVRAVRITARRSV